MVTLVERRSNSYVLFSILYHRARFIKAKSRLESIALSLTIEVTK